MSALLDQYVEAALAVNTARTPGLLRLARSEFVGDLWLDSAGRLLQDAHPGGRGTQCYERYVAWTHLDGVSDSIVTGAMHRAVHAVARDLSVGPLRDRPHRVVAPYGGLPGSADELRFAVAEDDGRLLVAGFARPPFQERPHVTMATDLLDWKRASERTAVDDTVLIERMRPVAARFEELRSWAEAITASGLVGEADQSATMGHVRQFADAVDGADAAAVVFALEALALPLAATRYAVLSEALQDMIPPDIEKVA